VFGPCPCFSHLYLLCLYTSLCSPFSLPSLPRHSFPSFIFAITAGVGRRLSNYVSRNGSDNHLSARGSTNNLSTANGEQGIMHNSRVSDSQGTLHCPSLLYPPLLRPPLLFPPLLCPPLLSSPLLSFALLSPLPVSLILHCFLPYVPLILTLFCSVAPGKFHRTGSLLDLPQSSGATELRRAGDLGPLVRLFTLVSRLSSLASRLLPLASCLFCYDLFPLDACLRRLSRACEARHSRDML
jgi:hypothetical protein